MKITASGLLVLGALGALLYFAHVAFIPIALALLFGLILSSPVEALHRRRIPRGLGALLILAVALGAVGACVALLWKPAQHWYADAPQTIRSIRLKIAPAERLVDRIDSIGKNAAAIGATNAAPATSPKVQVGGGATNTGPTSLATVLFSSTIEAAVSMLTFVILTLFLLTGGPPMLARMTAAFTDDPNASHAQTVIEAVRAEVARFYVVTATINVGLGCATTIVMMCWGMPTPYVWGIVAALLNFIPYAGASTTLALVTVVAFITFNEIGRVLGVAGSYLLLSAIEGQIIQPLFVGKHLEINPLLIFLSLWLGGLFWGVPGILLATPMLVALKVIAEHSTHGNAVIEFLGPNDQTKDGDKPLRRLVRKVSSRRNRKSK